MQFTSKIPHSCEHCQRITLDFGLEDNATQFSCGIREAFAADQAGCPLFRACFDDQRKENLWKDEFAERDDLILVIQCWKGELSNLTAHISHDPDDAASVDIANRPFELDYTSPAAIEFARSCIKSCQLDHEDCRRSANSEKNEESELIDPDSIPSRLIHLFTKDSTLYAKLIGRDLSTVVPKDEVSQEGFATLSYCWGGPQPVQLIRDSVRNFENAIPISRLPESLRDAAWFTNEMGLRYLWIDALCIIQDDPKDKSFEISRMELYYSHSTVTLCAASAARCSDGFLTPREEDAANYGVGPIQLRCITSQDTPGTVQASRLADGFGWEPPEPITTRGWTLQESLLSRRILIFSSRLLCFTCTVANASCGGLEPILKFRVMTSYESRIGGVHTFSALRYYPVRNVWNIVVEEYSKRHLGFPADKFPAIAAMASSLVSMSAGRNQKLLYLAGLMLDDSGLGQYSWRTQFLWAVNRMEDTHHVPHRAPSWSWASVDGSVGTWKWGWPEPDELPSVDEVEMLGHDIDFADGAAPYGAVERALVKIRARTQTLNAIAGLNYTISTDRDHANQRMDPGNAVLVLSPDTRERKQTLDKGIQADFDVFLVELIPFTEKEISPAGLIVTRAPEEENCYIRIGMFEFQKPDSNQTASEIASRQNLFSGLAFHEISMI